MIRSLTHKLTETRKAVSAWVRNTFKEHGAYLTIDGETRWVSAYDPQYGRLVPPATRKGYSPHPPFNTSMKDKSWHLSKDHPENQVSSIDWDRVKVWFKTGTY